MKIYIAGLYTSNMHLESRIFSILTDREKQARKGVRYLLESYHYVNKDTYVRRMRREKVKVFLDSGAFSAFTKGVEVDIKAYCRYIQANADIIECASVLDSIGNAQGTYENQLAMEKLGTKPLPCFHYGEDIRYLQYYVANYDHITLGGMVPISTPQLKFWLDDIWDKYLTDGSGRPLIKVHGFGLTTLSLMKRYPWYSVDSSSWIQMAAHGNLMTTKFGLVSISTQSPARKMFNQHLDSYPAPAREAVIKELTDQGYDIERFKTVPYARWVYNCEFFTELNNELNKKEDRFIPDQIGLF